MYKQIEPFTTKCKCKEAKKHNQVQPSATKLHTVKLSVSNMNQVQRSESTRVQEYKLRIVKEHKSDRL